MSPWPIHLLLLQHMVLWQHSIAIAYSYKYNLFAPIHPSGLCSSIAPSMKSLYPSLRTQAHKQLLFEQNSRLRYVGLGQGQLSFRQLLKKAKYLTNQSPPHMHHVTQILSCLGSTLLILVSPKTKENGILTERLNLCYPVPQTMLPSVISRPYGFSKFATQMEPSWLELLISHHSFEMATTKKHQCPIWKRKQRCLNRSN